MRKCEIFTGERATRQAIMTSLELLADQVQQAYARLESWRGRRPDAILRTPMLRLRSWPGQESTKFIEGHVFIKLECEQVTGSFKIRGALSAVAAAYDAKESRKPTIVTASTGNHALAVAHALDMMQVCTRGRIYMPRQAKPAKIEALRAYEKTVEIHFTEGDDCLLAELAARKFASETPEAIYISPCNDIKVIAGQGTIAIEILETLVSISGTQGWDGCHAGTLYATVGGGGMISGIAAYMKRYVPQWRIVGCQPENSAAMAASVKAGRVVNPASKPTLSDGSAGGLEEGKVSRIATTYM